MLRPLLLLFALIDDSSSLRLPAGIPASRRDVLPLGAGGAALLASFVAAPAFAKVDAAAAKQVTDTGDALKGLLKEKEAFVTGLVNGDASAPTLPAAVPFAVFQKLEKDADPEFMEAAIDYAEAHRNARDLVKLAKLSGTQVAVSVKEKGQPRREEIKSYGESGGLPYSTAEYAQRAVDEVLGASVALQAAIDFLPGAK